MLRLFSGKGFLQERGGTDIASVFCIPSLLTQRGHEMSCKSHPGAGRSVIMAFMKLHEAAASLCMTRLSLLVNHQLLGILYSCIPCVLCALGHLPWCGAVQCVQPCLLTQVYVFGFC